MNQLSNDRSLIIKKLLLFLKGGIESNSAEGMGFAYSLTLLSPTIPDPASESTNLDFEQKIHS